MPRGLGVVEWLVTGQPEWVAVLAGLATQLGDIWFLGLLLCALYWRLPAERQGVAFVGALFVVGIGATQALKYAIGLPRPAGPPDPATVSSVVRPVYEVTAFADGPGFPSGHATSAAVVYGGLAATLSAGPRRVRYGLAAALVALVALTRLVLANHYVVDVVAGAALGTAVVAVGSWVRRVRARRTAQ